MSTAMALPHPQLVGLQHPGLMRRQATGHSLCQLKTGAVPSGVTAESQATFACCHMLFSCLHTVPCILQMGPASN